MHEDGLMQTLPETAGGTMKAMRLAISLQGTVQGVGFRPFVFRLATRFGLAGFVKNQAGGVLIEVEGKPRAVEQFRAEIAGELPPLARIERMDVVSAIPLGDRRFRIAGSGEEAGHAAFFCPDIATCIRCLTELLDPSDRRYRYPFLNCTDCGPRLSIIRSAPYDRERTTMAGFPMCDTCRQEYEDPGNRRFHAEPTACASCGPRLQLFDASGQPVTGDPLRTFAGALLAGRIGALKGIGGFHLVCDARNETAVADLRCRKHREQKPFAVMVADEAAARALCAIGPAELRLLRSPQVPIVLLRKQRSSAGISRFVAPGNPFLGVMLPYTPLHHLLMREVENIPLVMTSGNQTDEPIASENDEAVRRLAGIADFFLTHNRPIRVRCDDSVTRVLDGQELPVRRSRGYAPRPISVPFDLPCSILAVGGQWKGTFALGRDRYAILSHHLGDLDHLEAYRAFVNDISLYEELHSFQPEVIAHDSHPDYASTRYAGERANSKGAIDVLVPVQHHHAHMASCMAENGLVEPVIGVIFDGTGLGTDGAVWGGEFLIGDYRGFRRGGHFRYVGMPGGDRAIREPWRMAVAHLLDAEVSLSSLEIATRAEIGTTQLRIVEQLLQRGFRTPRTSSVGRLFDAVASLAGVRQKVSFEGQAAMELEWLATDQPVDGAFPFTIEEGCNGEWNEPMLVVDTRPLIRALCRDSGRGVGPAVIARRFHSTLVEIVAGICTRLRKQTQLKQVVLSGGVFGNAILSTEVPARLQSEGFQVFRHRLVPPNDGGLSLGQLAIAAFHVSDNEKE